MADEENGNPESEGTDKHGSKAGAGDADGTVLGDESGVHVGSVPESDEPPIDFGNFLMSLAHSALIALGVVDNPVSGQKEHDLDSARQTIEIIEMLKEKTDGNLDEDEAKLIGSLLYELRISFVRASAKKVND